MAALHDRDDPGEGDVDQHRIQHVERGRNGLQGHPPRHRPLHPHLPTLLRVPTLPDRQQLRAGRNTDEEHHRDQQGEAGECDPYPATAVLLE